MPTEQFWQEQISDGSTLLTITYYVLDFLIFYFFFPNFFVKISCKVG
jgi:hypothetical protein